MTHYQLTKVSGNSKTGPIPVSTSSKSTCPKACPFRRDNEGGCYADSGGPIQWHFDKVSRGAKGTDFSAFLKEVALSSGLSQVFWVRIPEDLLSPIQFHHQDCRPHVFAIELGMDSIKFEFFVRNLKNMRCTCPGYCTEPQRNYIFSFAHGMIEQLGITT